MSSPDRTLIHEFHNTLASSAPTGDTEVWEEDLRKFRKSLNGRSTSSDTLIKPEVIMNDPILPDWLRRGLKAVGLIIPLLAIVLKIDASVVGELFANLGTWGSLTLVMVNEIVQFLRGLKDRKAEYLKWSTKR